MKKGYSYHIVTNSPWPLTSSISLLSMLLGLTTFLQKKVLLFNSFDLLGLSIISLVISLYFWWSDVHNESIYQGEHTLKVQDGISLGFLLFVFSEILIFFSLFFAFFYNALIPDNNVGGVWPPVGIITLDYKSVPLLNTLILLSSGFTITACHNFLLNGSSKLNGIFYLSLTILLGLVFTYFQYFEYIYSPFTISDSVFGSSFFILTGCHALHILIGSFMLIVCLFRFSFFTNSNHLLFKFSGIYWHFVDAVWLFLYIVIYCWCA